MIQNILFDLDGTLTDSQSGVTNCIRYALECLGQSVLSAEELHWCIGPSLFTSFGKLLNTEDTNEINRAVELYRERFASVGKFENALYPGIPETLATLKEREHRLFVATSKPHVYTREILRHFGLYDVFDGIYGSELNGKHGDKGELIAYLLHSERLEAPHTMMIGDRSYDIIGGKKNKVRTGGVTYGYGTIEELTSHEADILYHSPQDIAADFSDFR